MTRVFVYSQESVEGDRSVLLETGVSQIQLLCILSVKTRQEIFYIVFIFGTYFIITIRNKI